MMCRWMGVLTRVQNFGGIAPLKFKKAKNVQNLAWFKTTFDFDCEYLWKKLYQQAIQLPFLSCWTKKPDEPWSTNRDVVFAHFDLPNIDSARVFRQLSTLSTNISGTNQDIDKRLTAFLITIYSTLNAKKGGLGFTNRKVVFAHFDLPNIDSWQFTRFQRTLDFDRIYLERYW